ncbi:DUF2635 domain-containing protein [Martelella alba]|uniref:DUF2635 domain-containing protein n=1 Tax=Martelella alba TaxID=2590451 RepID=A0ABY2SE02_9HYPH|nr:DUF2635 domain-containing protein [Martelella alba]TKI02894.1 DUF2635 domain-containing protein [Martelella alba]
MFVKPNTGRAVRDPVKGTLLPAEGAEVPDTSFWRRRLRDGDVSIAAATSAPADSTDTAASATATASTAAQEDTK